jgi:hypothetical protein
VVANVHYVKLIISVPLKTAISQFTLFKIFTLPDEVSSDKSVQYSIDSPYFGLQSSQRDYILFTEADYQHCSKGSITLCSASTPIYRANLFTCESSLYFQTASEHRLCQRNLLVNHQTPTLHQHQTLWIYNFPVPLKVTINCHGANGRASNTLLLHGKGLLRNASTCYVTRDELQTLPDLHGSTQAEFAAPKFFLPGRIPILRDHEMQQLEKINPADFQMLDEKKISGYDPPTDTGLRPPTPHAP